jgi:hypothetical protein
VTADVTMKKKIDCIQSEKRPVARANASDSAAAAMSPISSALQFVPPAYRGRLTPCADAEEHHMREQQDARITINRS